MGKTLFFPRIRMMGVYFLLFSIELDIFLSTATLQKHNFITQVYYMAKNVLLVTSRAPSFPRLPCSSVGAMCLRSSQWMTMTGPSLQMSPAALQPSHLLLLTQRPPTPFWITWLQIEKQLETTTIRQSGARLRPQAETEGCVLLTESRCESPSWKVCKFPTLPFMDEMYYIVYFQLHC